MKIKIRKGLNIPLKGNPENPIIIEKTSSSIAIDFKPFKHFKIKTLLQEDDKVEKNQVIAFFKNSENIRFLSPFFGVVKSINRGLKRVLEEVVIEKTNQQPESSIFEKINLQSIETQQLTDFLSFNGAFSLIKMRPFNLPAIPQMLPQEIFVNLAENAPFSIPLTQQIQSFESEKQALFYFEQGLRTLFKLTAKKIKIIYRNTPFFYSDTLKEICDFIEIQGPYPSGCTSLHMYKIKPIVSEKNIRWTLSFNEISSIGYLINTGSLYNKRVVSVVGPALKSEERRYIKTEVGVCINDLVPKEIDPNKNCIISGCPLSGKLVTNQNKQYLGLFDNVVSIIPKNEQREAFHFLKLGTKKFTATKTYASGFLRYVKKTFEFTTNQHGEQRAFIDPSVYDSFMPMNIPLINLAKAILSENFELAKSLGFLEICDEDCILATFICPSKNNILEIIQKGQERYVKESGFLPFM